MNKVHVQGPFTVLYNMRPNRYNPYVVHHNGKTVFRASCLGVCKDYINDNLTA